jgi:hypothetical protein
MPPHENGEVPVLEKLPYMNPYNKPNPTLLVNGPLLEKGISFVKHQGHISSHIL